MEHTHPTEQEITNFVHFHLTVDEAHEVGRHLRVCADCNTRYREMYQGKPGAPAVPELQIEAGFEVSSF